MRVLQIIGNSRFGGGVYYVLSIARQLSKEGQEIFILVENPVCAQYFREAGFKVLSTNAFRREISPYYDLKALGRLIYLINRLRPDLIHTHTSKGGFIGRLAARIAKAKKVIHTVHGFAFHEFSSPFAQAFYSWLERYASRFCQRLIFVNKKDCDCAREKKIGDERKRRIVYNGINYRAIEKISPNYQLKNELRLPDDAFLLTFTGRLSAQKNPKVLIEGLPNILKDYPNTYLLLIGDDLGLEKELRVKAKRLKVYDNVRFLGFRKDCVACLKSSDCFVLPSLWEGLSISLLEAMACGLPCLVSDIKGNNEVIVDGKNGFLFPPKAPDCFAEKVKQLIASKELRRRLGEEAKRTVRELFSEEIFLRETMKIYQECGLVSRFTQGVS